MSLNTKQSLPRVLQGQVTSTSMHKTITVKVSRRVKHDLYDKIISKSTKVHAHDEEQTAKVGDFVVVRESKPLSKTKCWTLVEIKSRAQQ